MVQLIRNLFKSIDEKWSEKKYAEDYFFEICSEKLAEKDASDLLRKMVSSPFNLSEFNSIKPHGASNVFSLFHSLHYSAYVHIWTETFATPHHHGWNGLFVLLKGEALHGKYAFDSNGEISNRLSTGNLSLIMLEKLNEEQPIKIKAGSECIHGIWHTSNPSIL